MCVRVSVRVSLCARVWRDVYVHARASERKHTYSCYIIQRSKSPRLQAPAAELLRKHRDSSNNSINVQKENDDNAEESCELCIEVSDTGVGIPAAQQEHLFEPFFQGNLMNTQLHTTQHMHARTYNTRTHTHSSVTPVWAFSLYI